MIETENTNWCTLVMNCVEWFVTCSTLQGGKSVDDRDEVLVLMVVQNKQHRFGCQYWTKGRLSTEV